MLLIPSWRGLMARNCGGQHQRRPGLSLMGLAAFTILIRSLSLKSTDWPLHLHEPDSCGTPPPLARIWPRGSSHTAPPGDLGQSTVHTGGFCSQVCSLHIHLSFSPTGCFFFFYFSLTFFHLSVWSPVSSVSLCQSPLFIWPSRPSALLLLLSRNWRWRGGGRRRRRRNGRRSWLQRRRKRD